MFNGVSDCDVAFCNSVKIDILKQLGSGGQAVVFECKFSCEG